MLLSRMQNFNLNSDNPTEKWLVRSVADDQDEDELYIKGHTAVWTQGLAEEYAMPRVALTCESPIKFGFFCPPTFVGGAKNYGVGLLDAKCLKVYFKNGEDYMTAIETPISHVWVTRHGLLLEKDPSSVDIGSHCIAMPRLFSLEHPLTEMCPVLIKTPLSVSYIVEADFKVVFSAPDTDLVLMFDLRTGKHFVCRLRAATADEIQKVAGSEANTTIKTSHHSVGPNSSKNLSGLVNRNVSHHQSLSVGSGYSSTVNQSSVASPLQQLQSSLGHSMTSHDFRKMEQIEPSKPIVPELCLDVIWTDNSGSRDFNEEASHGFIHTDLIGQKYLCYLLPHTYKLNLAKMERSHTPATQVFGMVSSITAKDAVNLSVNFFYFSIFF